MVGEAASGRRQDHDADPETTAEELWAQPAMIYYSGVTPRRLLGKEIGPVAAHAAHLVERGLNSQARLSRRRG